MGLIRFLVPRPDRIPPEAVSKAYMAGMDEVPWASRIVATEDVLIVDRPVGDSGYLHIPWRVEGFGEMMLSTASLMERDQVYLLEVELARGTLNRIRNQIADWESVGMAIPEPIEAQLKGVTETFSRAVTSKVDAMLASELATDVIVECMAIMRSLSASYAQQALALRHSSGSRLVTMLGANLGTVPFDDHLVDDHLARSYLGAFNAAVVPMAWQHLETSENKYDWSLTDSQLDWCKTHALKVSSGPLVQLDGTEIPDWLYLWEEDPETLTIFVKQYVRSIVNRYRGRVHVWQAASRINSGNFLGLSHQDTVRMAIQIVETIRDLDSRTPVIISFDQLWGDSLSQKDYELPVYLADTLARANLGLSGIGLEIKLAYHPGGTSHRDALKVSRQLDRWSSLGLPLLVSLVVPGGTGPDAKAQAQASPLPDEWDPDRQNAWVQEHLPVMLGKQAVQGIMWNQFSDSHPHVLPHGGLIDGNSQPKSALASVSAIRKAHLS